VRRTYDGIATTRRRQLERQLERVEEVREERGVPVQVVEERPRLLRVAADGSETREDEVVADEVGTDEVGPGLPAASAG
jgi:hypothetical protein